MNPAPRNHSWPVLRAAGLLLLFTATLAGPAPAQFEVARFERLDTGDGLSHPAVSDIHQDAAGYLWVATGHGLNRYDGYTFKVFRSDPQDSTSIPGAWTRNLFEDGGDGLWVALVQGVTRYDPVTRSFAHFEHDPADPKSLCAGSLNAILEDDAGSVWIATEAGGLCRWNVETGTFEQTVLLPEPEGEDPIVDLVRDSNGFVWAATASRGLYRIDPAAGTWTRFHADAQTLPSDQVRSLGLDTTGRPWAGLESGHLVVWDGARQVWESCAPAFDHPVRLLAPSRRKPGAVWAVTGPHGLWLATDHGPPLPHDLDENDGALFSGINVLHEDADGHLWVGANSGLLSLTPEGDRHRHRYRSYDSASMPSGPVIAIHEDRAGNLWFGTRWGGLAKFNPRQRPLRQHVFPDPGAEDMWKVIRSVAEEPGGDLWLGTYFAGLHRFRPEAGTTTVFLSGYEEPHSLAEHAIAALLPSRVTPNRLWIGSSGGLLAFDIRTESVTAHAFALPDGSPFLYEVQSLEEDNEGRLLVGTLTGGLFRLDLESTVLAPFPGVAEHAPRLSEGHVSALARAHDGSIWVATVPHGLHRIGPHDELEAFTHEVDARYPLSVMALYADPDGAVWLGTYTGGLVRFDSRTDSLRQYTLTNGAPTNWVHGVLPDAAGRLWLSSDRGLISFHKETEEFTLYDRAYGLHRNSFLAGASCARGNGELVMGGVQGLTRFHPRALLEAAHPPPMVFTAFTSLSEVGSRDLLTPVLRGETLELGPGENHITFEFSALDFTSPETNRYAYRLAGADKRWVESGSRRFAAYSHLDPGRYLLQVKGAGHSGEWSADSALTVALVVHPPMWRSSWFLVLCALLLLTGVVAWHRLRVRTALRQATALEKVRSEESLRVRREAARDFHDDLGHIATKIALFSDIMNRRFAGHDDGEAKEYLEKIGSGAKRLATGMEDFVWTLDPDHDSLREVVVRLKDFGDELFTKTGVAFRIAGLDGDLDAYHLDMESRRNLTMIFKEAMTNALKHSGCRSVRLEVSADARGYRLAVEDDGTGLPAPGDHGEANGNGHGNGHGFGMRNMRARSERLGARFQLSPLSPQGTRVEVFVPPRPHPNGEPS